MLGFVLVVAAVLLVAILVARALLPREAAAMVERGISSSVSLVGKIGLVGLALSIIYLAWKASYAPEMP